MDSHKFADLAGRVHLDLCGGGVGHVEGVFPAGMTNEEEAVADECLFPVASVCADGEELFGADPLAEALFVGFESVDGADVAFALGAFEDDGGVVDAACIGGKVFPTDDSCPFTEQIDIAGIIHLVDEVCASWSAADLAEDDFAVGFVIPLHVGKACSHAEGFENAFAEFDASADLGLVEICDGDDHGADPLVGSGDKRAWEVLCDVRVCGFTVDADGIEGKFFAVDEFFYADFGNVAERREDALEFFVVLNAVGVGASGSCDGFDDHGEADQVGGFFDILFGVCAKSVWYTQASAGDAFFHQLFVAKAKDGVVGHARDAEFFAEFGSGEHKDLPLGFDAIHTASSEPLFDAGDQIAFVHDARDLEIITEVGANSFGESMCRCITNAEDTGADFGKAACVFNHFGWISWAQKEDLHGELLQNARCA